MAQGRHTWLRRQRESWVAVWHQLPRWRQWWLGAGGVLALAWALGALLAGISLTPVQQLLALWAVLTGLALGPALWRRLTYRIGVRLFLSYLVIGVTPLVLTGALAFVTAYLLTGQYAAATLRAALELQYDRLEQLAHLACRQRGGGGRAQLAEAAREYAGAGLALAWVVEREGTVDTNTPDLAAGVPGWGRDEGWRGLVLVGERLHAGVTAACEGTQVALLLPLDPPTVRAISREEWYEARFVVPRPRGPSVTVTLGTSSARPPKAPPAGGDAAVPGEGSEEEWLLAQPGEGGIWRGRWVVWAAGGAPARLWRETTDEEAGWAVALLKVSPGGAFHHLFSGGRPQLAEEAIAVLGFLGLVLGGVYAVAVGLAGWMIVAIARSTSRLTRGAREIARGNLAYRIPVARRDQLGELALAFNGMAEAVQNMLAEMREKERLTQELALAREIQRRLLPHTAVRHGSLMVTAHFRPAAEIGGDFYEVVRLEGGQLVAAVGDVAGHGLPTGLHMAMLKAALAALVREGRRGQDLLLRLNQLVQAEGGAQRMVTLAVAEIDPTAQRLTLTSAGHPPAYLLRRGEVCEVAAPALPLGFAWSNGPGQVEVTFSPGDLCVLYSDGLVEARAKNGELLGYPGLRDILAAAAAGTGEDVLAACLAALEAHLDGAPLPDDVTIVVVEFLPAEEALEGLPATL